MILGQYNILGFYASKEARVWNRLVADNSNYELFRIFLETNTLPAIQLIVDASTTATMYLLDSSDAVIGSGVAMTVEANTQVGITYDRLIYLGSTLSGNADGDYSLKIVNGSNTYYSDVFGWTSNSEYLDDMVKISATSSDIRIGKDYRASLSSSFTFECYINAEYNGIQPEVEETVQIKYGVSNSVYSNLVETREFDVYGNEYILRFLLGLRILETNGTITITWKSVDYVASDIISEKTDDHSPDTMQIKLSFIVENEILGTLNDV